MVFSLVHMLSFVGVLVFLLLLSLSLGIFILSYDVVSVSEITPCNKFNKPLVVYRFLGNVMK